MKRIMLGILIAILLALAIGFWFISSDSGKKPRRLTVKFLFGREGKGLGEYFKPAGLAIKDNYLYVADSGNARIQTLMIQPNGELLPKFSFGKEGKGLGEFGLITGLAIKEDYFYVVDSDGNHIQVLEK